MTHEALQPYNTKAHNIKTLKPNPNHWLPAGLNCIVAPLKLLQGQGEAKQARGSTKTPRPHQNPEATPKPRGHTKTPRPHQKPRGPAKTPRPHRNPETPPKPRGHTKTPRPRQDAKPNPSPKPPT